MGEFPWLHGLKAEGWWSLPKHSRNPSQPGANRLKEMSANKLQFPTQHEHTMNMYIMYTIANATTNTPTHTHWYNSQNIVHVCLVAVAVEGIKSYQGFWIIHRHVRERKCSGGKYGVRYAFLSALSKTNSHTWTKKCGFPHTHTSTHIESQTENSQRIQNEPEARES